MASRLKTIAAQMKALREQAIAERSNQMKDAPLSPEGFKKAIEKFEMTQEQAGVFFGVSPRQGQRWALGEVMIPNSVAIAVDLMLKHGKTPKDYLKKLHLEDVLELA